MRERALSRGLSRKQLSSWRSNGFHVPIAATGFLDGSVPCGALIQPIQKKSPLCWKQAHVWQKRLQAKDGTQGNDFIGSQIYSARNGKPSQNGMFGSPPPPPPPPPPLLSPPEGRKCKALQAHRAFQVLLTRSQKGARKGTPSTSFGNFILHVKGFGYIQSGKLSVGEHAKRFDKEVASKLGADPVIKYTLYWLFRLVTCECEMYPNCANPKGGSFQGIVQASCVHDY